MQRVRDRVKAITAPRHRLQEPVEPLVAELNLVLRGWGAYFRVGNASRQFAQVDRYVRERLALFLSKKAGRRGRRWARHTVGVLPSARRLSPDRNRHLGDGNADSGAVNDLGKPCAGEPHARCAP